MPAANGPNKSLRVIDLELRGMPNRPESQESHQVVRGSAIATNGVDRRTKSVFVMIEPALTEVGHRDRLEAHGRRRTDGKLSVDLGRKLLRRSSVRTDTRSMTLAVLVVAEVPDLVAKIRLNFANSERLCSARHRGSFREPSCQKRHKQRHESGIPRQSRKRKSLRDKQLCHTGRQTSGEGGIRTRGTLSRTQHFQCCTIGRSVTSPTTESYLTAGLKSARCCDCSGTRIPSP